MHTGPVLGDFVDNGKEINDYPCRKCKSKNVVEQLWESSCGGYDDYKFTCQDCGYYWWEEGSDS